MNKVFYVGSGGINRKLEEMLLDRGASLFRFRSIGTIRYRAEDSPDLMIIERAQSREPSFKELLKKFRETPKIVLSDNPSFSGISPWLKSELICPLYAPTAKELEFALKKILHEKELLTENRRLKHRLAITKQELDFFEEVSKTLTSAVELNVVLGTIMKKAKPLIKAEAWSILLLDEETGELILEKTAGKRRAEKRSRRSDLSLEKA